MTTPTPPSSPTPSPSTAEKSRTLPRGAVARPAAQSRETELGVRRVRHIRPYAAMLFISLGLMVWGVELVLHWWKSRAIEGAPVALGSIIAFVGFYLLDHNDTIAGATFVVDKSIALIRTVRGGRATDPPGTVVETTVAKDEGKAS